MKRSVLSLFFAFVCAAAVVRTAAGVTIHRSFTGGYPSAVSEARSRYVSTGPASAAAVSRPDRVRAPNKLFGTAKCIEGSSVKLTVLNSDGEHVVMLDKIAPPPAKMSEARGVAAKLLHDLVDGKEVEVLWTKRRKGDIVGVVYFRHPQGMVEVNLTLVKNGCARQSIYDSTAAYAAAEKDARKHRRGMWSAK